MKISQMKKITTKIVFVLASVVVIVSFKSNEETQAEQTIVDMKSLWIL